MTHDSFDYERTLVANILNRLAGGLDNTSATITAADLRYLARELETAHEGDDIQMLTNAIAEAGGGRLDDESLGFGSWYSESDLDLSSLRGKMADVDEGEIGILGTDETIAISFQAGSTNFTAVVGLVEFEDLREGLNSQARERALAARSKS
jgi:hypothetical protein